MPKDARGGKKMIMVDQLWLWCIQTLDVGSSKCKTSILTSFPQKKKEMTIEDDIEEIADLHQAIIDEANSKDNMWAVSRLNFVVLIIEQAVNPVLGVRTEESLDFLNVFRAAIGEAVSLHHR